MKISTNDGSFFGNLGFLVAALALSSFGMQLAYLGFILPGFLWCSNFTSTEMITLVVCFCVGTVGLVLWKLGYSILKKIN